MLRILSKNVQNTQRLLFGFHSYIITTLKSWKKETNRRNVHGLVIRSQKKIRKKLYWQPISGKIQFLDIYDA